MDWGPFLLSLQLALATAVLLLPPALVAARGLARWQSPMRAVVEAMLTLPLVLPPTVLGYYLIVLIGRNGVIGVWLERLFGIRLLFTWQGAVVAAAVVAVAARARKAATN